MDADSNSRRSAQPVYRPLYLNANLVYSEALKRIRIFGRSKDNLLAMLATRGYSLATSILTKMEVIQRLRREENKTLQTARLVYAEVISTFHIAEIVSLDKKVQLTNAFLDSVAGTNLDFKDAIHLAIAKKLRMPLCTHDKKLLRGFSTHEDKQDFYSEVYKPSDFLD